MKRKNSTTKSVGEPKKKISRTEATTTHVAPPSPFPTPSLDLPWRFVTATEGGEIDITEWDPKSAKDPKAVADAFLAALAASKAKDGADPDGYPKLYFSEVIGWCIASPICDKPAEFKGIDRKDIGKLRDICSEEYIQLGPTIFYESWC